MDSSIIYHTYKERFLQNLKRLHPNAKNEDELYMYAIQGYHNEHEYAKKIRNENKNFEQNLNKHPEFAELLVAFFSPTGNDMIPELFSNLCETQIEELVEEIKKDHKRYVNSIIEEVIDNVIIRLNKKIDKTCIYMGEVIFDNFTTFDCIAADYQEGMSLDEIAPGLRNIIEDMIQLEYDALEDEKRLIIEYSESNISKNVLIPDEDAIQQILYDEFIERLDDDDITEKTREAIKADSEEEEYSDNNSVETKWSDSANKKKGFAAVAGLQELKLQLQSDIIDVIREPNRAKALGLSLPNGILLYGPPGCGKTFFAQKLAEEAGCEYIHVNCSDLASTYIHGTQEKIANVFNKAEKQSPCIIFFDEIDAMIAKREMYNNISMRGEVNEFLTQLNHCGKRGIMVIAATNRPQDIDVAALRSGRLDTKYYFPIPDYNTRMQLFVIKLHKISTRGALMFDKLAEKTEGYVSADIEKIVDLATRMAFREKKDYITMSMLETIIETFKPTVSAETIHEHETIRDKFENNYSNQRKRIGFNAENYDN